MIARVVYPRFDPLTSTWFMNSPQLEAPSLCELQLKLGSAIKLGGYYPKGFNSVPMAPVPPPYVPLERLDPSKITKPFVPSIKTVTTEGTKVEVVKDKVTVTKKHQKARVYYARLSPLHNKVLDLWAEGLTGPEIGLRLGLNRSTDAAGIVWLHRQKGDPRAVSRLHERTKKVR